MCILNEEFFEFHFYCHLLTTHLYEKKAEFYSKCGQFKSRV